MTMTEGMIGNVTVRSKAKYIVFGTMRGLVSEHRKLYVARLSAEKDRKSCGSLGGGAYSDVAIYESVDGCWKPAPRKEY